MRREEATHEEETKARSRSDLRVQSSFPPDHPSRLQLYYYEPIAKTFQAIPSYTKTYYLQRPGNKVGSDRLWDVRSLASLETDFLPLPSSIFSLRAPLERAHHGLSSWTSNARWKPKPTNLQPFFLRRAGYQVSLLFPSASLEGSDAWTGMRRAGEDQASFREQRKQRAGRCRDASHLLHVACFVSSG